MFLAAIRCVRADVTAIEDQFRAAYELYAGTKHAAEVADLDSKYVVALERAMGAATQGQRLDEALALRDEIQRVQDKVPLPDKDDDIDPVLVKFRGTYRAQSAKLSESRQKAATPIIEQFDAALAAYQEELTKAGKLDEAYVVRDYRAAGLAEKLMGKAAAVSLTAASTAPEKPFENSLGMRFFPVPITGGPSEGKTIRFSAWETRVKDYAAFVKDEKLEWPEPVFAQGVDHPAVNVCWEDATAFCAWLTKLERRKRKIGPKDVYRLPTDHEWSCAVGLGKDEDPAAAPAAKDGKVAGYPWGADLPPPKGAGNFAGEEARGQGQSQGYNDGFERTAPVGSFAPNAFSLHDLDGNVAEWCQEWRDPSNPVERVLRGGSWNVMRDTYLRSSYRRGGTPERRNDFCGFRVVLELGSGG